MGLIGTNWCCMCRKAKEFSSHLFLHCPIVAALWEFMIFRLNASWVLLGTMKTLIHSWSSQDLSSLNHHGKVARNLIPFAVCWTVWEERNLRIFEDRSAPLHKLIDFVFFKLHEWLLAGSLGFRCQFSSWVFDWNSLLQAL